MIWNMLRKYYYIKVVTNIICQSQMDNKLTSATDRKLYDEETDSAKRRSASNLLMHYKMRCPFLFCV